MSTGSQVGRLGSEDGDRRAAGSAVSKPNGTSVRVRASEPVRGAPTIR